MEVPEINTNKVEIINIMKFLQEVVPEGKANTWQIAVAGSAAMYWYQVLNEVGPVWRNGAKPGDVDVFVCGENNFTAFCRALMKAIRRSGRVIESRNVKIKRYVCFSHEVMILDLVIRDIAVPISFIQVCCEDNVCAVASKFDIDVCQVVWNISKNRFTMRPTAKQHIADGKFEVLRTFGFVDKGDPKEWEMKKVVSTMRRMKKFTSRGFSAVNGSCVVFAGCPDEVNVREVNIVAHGVVEREENGVLVNVLEEDNDVEMEVVEGHPEADL